MPGLDTNSIELCPDGSLLATSANEGRIRRLTLTGAGTLVDTGEFLALPGQPNNLACAPGGLFGLVVTRSEAQLRSFRVAGLVLEDQVALGSPLGIGLSVVTDPAGTRIFVRTSVSLEGYGFDSLTGNIDSQLFELPVAPTITCFGIEQVAMHPGRDKLYARTGEGVLAVLNLDEETIGAVVHPDLDTPMGVCVRARACFTLDFETADDLSTPLGNGQHLDIEFGTLATLTASGPNAGAAVFDSTPGGPNDPSQDLDLLVDTGHLVILQTENFPPDGNDVFPRPNDDEDGGTLSFAFATAVELSSVRLVDIDSSDGTSRVILSDAAGRQRTYSVPAGWTGDRAAGEPGQGTLELASLAPQPGFASQATASQQAGFDGTRVVRVDFELAGSAAIDDLSGCRTGSALARASAVARNGAGLNPWTLASAGLPVIGGTWVTNLDCSGHGAGLAVLLVRAAPAAGLTLNHCELLVGGPSYFRSARPHAGELAVFTRDIPYTLSLCGLRAYAQGLCSGAPPPRGSRTPWTSCWASEPQRSCAPGRAGPGQSGIRSPPRAKRSTWKSSSSARGKAGLSLVCRNRIRRSSGTRLRSAK
jgi:hypothetical protein